jgi:hypothetical protein
VRDILAGGGALVLATGYPLSASGASQQPFDWQQQQQRYRCPRK